MEDAQPKPTQPLNHYLCVNCGQDSLIGGKCPNCGNDMILDSEKLPGEKAPDEEKEVKVDRVDAISDDQDDLSSDPEKYSLEELAEAEEKESFED